MKRSLQTICYNCDYNGNMICELCPGCNKRFCVRCHSQNIPKNIVENVFQKLN